MLPETTGGLYLVGGAMMTIALTQSVVKTQYQCLMQASKSDSFGSFDLLSHSYIRDNLTKVLPSETEELISLVQKMKQTDKVMKKLQ